MSRLRVGLLSLALVTLLPLMAATPGSNQERLRAFVRLPRVNFSIKLGCDARTGYSFTWSASPSPTELKAFRKEGAEGAEAAAGYREIGLLLLQYDAYDPATAALQESLRCLQGLGAPQSASAPMLADYARTLMLLSRDPEAVREAQRAAELAPGDWRTHAALARCLAASAVAEVAPPDAPAERSNSDPADWAARGAWKIPPANAEKARNLARDAVKAADRGVELAVNESSVWLDRAVVKSLTKLIEYLVEVSTGAEFSPARVSQSLFPREALADLTRAAELAPQNARLQGIAAMYAVMTVAVERGNSSLDALMGSGAWALLDEAGQRRLRGEVSRLEAVTANGDPAVAASGWEVLGVIQMLGTRELARAASSFRQALQLDPERDSAWEGLVASLVIGERFDDLAALCVAKLKKRDSAYARLLLAKAYERTQDYTKVLEALEPAQRRFPDDFLVNLATAAAILREGTDDNSFARAAQLIGRAEKAAGNSPTPDQMVNLMVARGLLFALLDQSEAARANLQRVLEADPSREDVREVLKLIQ